VRRRTTPLHRKLW
jgi:hypothetical protein